MKERQISPELLAFGIHPSGKRDWIPVEGLQFPKVDAKHNLSAGLQSVEFPFAHGTIPVVRRGRALEQFVGIVSEQQRNLAYGLFAVASDNDTMYEKIIVPTINAYLKDHGGNHVLIPSIGYPIIDWWKEGLQKAGNSLVEADFFHIMQKGKLPGSIKAVYLDFPGTFFSASYKSEQVKNWIAANPDVLFVIDQANLGFFNQVQSERAYTLLDQLPPSTNLLLTNTTTKASSVRVVAQTWAPKEFVTKYGSQSDLPLQHGLSHGQLRKAIQLFHPANLEQAARLRQAIIAHREYLKKVLAQKYGETAVFNAAATQGHALILNAKAFGFADGEAFSQALANGVIPIGVKSTKYYTDVSKNPWVKDFVYVSIPFDVQVMQDLCQALGVDGI